MEPQEPTPALGSSEPVGPDARLSELLARAAAGESDASRELLPLVYDHLRAMARARLSKEPAGITLQPTALVHEAYLRLVGGDRPWQDKRHFFAAAGLAMRRILVDRARARRGEKRGGKFQRVALDQVDDECAQTHASEGTDWIGLERAMTELEAHDPDMASIVHLRYFAGLSVEQVAQVMGISTRTVNREWFVARAWLLRRMRTDEST